jgi:signal peptidase I
VNIEKYRAVARRWWRQEIRPLLIFLLVMFSIRSSLADWNVVPTGSMKPTILEGDRVFVNKLAYDLKVPFTTWHVAEWRNPQRGDIVVFFSPKDGQRLVKRVIGLPGDTIELRNEQLIINGRPAEYAAADPGMAAQLSGIERERGVFATEELPASPHAVMAINGVPAMRSFAPVQVPQGRYFMMGDNRDNSFDSRYFGTVARGQIVGRATTVVLSLNQENHWLPRWSRTGASLESPAR